MGLRSFITIINLINNSISNNVYTKLFLSDNLIIIKSIKSNVTKLSNIVGNFNAYTDCEKNMILNQDFNQKQIVGSKSYAIKFMLYFTDSRALIFESIIF